MLALTTLEKAPVTTLGGFALLMFFFPLLVFQAPIVGEQDVSGYDVFSKVKQFSSQVQKQSGQSTTTPKEADSKPETQTLPQPDLPLSLKLAWLLSVSITLAFILSVTMILAAQMGKGGVVVLAAYLGTAFAAIAILHIMIGNSDFHSWTAASMKTNAGDVSSNPFTAMAGIMVNAFKIKPGAGLYFLAACLATATVTTKSRFLTKFSVVKTDSQSAAH